MQHGGSTPPISTSAKIHSYAVYFLFLSNFYHVNCYIFHITIPHYTLLFIILYHNFVTFFGFFQA